MASFTFSMGGIIVIFMLMCYMAIGTFLETRHAIVGHESGLIIIIGVGFSYLVMATEFHHFSEMITFDSNFFFYFCLPPIVFAAGYNMKRKKFFENFTNILLFGLFSTLLAFTFFSFFTYLVVRAGVLWKYNPST